MGGRDHSCDGCGRGGLNDPDGRCVCAEEPMDYTPFSANTAGEPTRLLPMVTNAMVERAAHAIQEVESSADATSWNTGAWFFEAARAALDAAFHGSAFPRKDEN